MPAVTDQSLEALSLHPAWEEERFMKLLDNLSETAVGEMLGIYQEGLETAIQKARSAQSAKDYETLQKMAHRLKPTAEMLGFVTFSRECALIEDEKSADHAAVETWLTNATQVLKTIKSAL